MMRPTALLLTLVAALMASTMSVADPEKPLASADRPDSLYAPGQGVVFALTVRSRPGHALTARVTRLAVGGKQLAATQLTASVEPADASGPATLVLRDASAASDATPTATAKPDATTSPCGPAQASPPQGGPLLDQGDYTASVLVCEAGGTRQVSLDLRFSKKPATIKTDAILKLHRVSPLLWVIHLPGGDTPAVPLFETSGASDIYLQAAPYRATLATTDGALTTTLSPPSGAAGPTVIPAGGSTLLDVSFSGEDHIGVAQGAIVLRAPELVGGVTLVPIEVTTRASFWVLAFVLAAGLGLGAGVRQVLEPSRTRNLAVADAYTALIRLEAPLREPLDPTETARLQAIRGALDQAIANDRNDADKITAATTTFNADLDTFLKERAQHIADAAKLVDDWSAPLNEDRDQPAAVAAALTALKSAAIAARIALQKRNWPAAGQAVDTVRQGLSGEVQDALTHWRRGAEDDLSQLPAWPDLPAAGRFADTAAKAVDAVGTSPADNDPSAFAQQLRATRSARQALRDELFHSRANQIVDYAARLRAGFARLPIGASHADLQIAVDLARDRLSGMVTQGADDHLDAYVTAESALFAALVALFEAVLPAATNPGVAQGHFEDALKTLATKSAARPLGPAGAPTPPQQPPVRQLFLAHAPGAAVDGVGRIRLSAPIYATAGSPIAIGVELLDGTKVNGTGTVRWTIGGALIVGGLQLSYTVSRAGTLPIQATVETADGAMLVAFTTLEVLPLPDGAARKQAVDKAKVAAALQLVAAAAVIGIGGFTLFAPSFLGTWDQLAAAFLWGFASDLGLSKAMELAKGAKPVAAGS